MLSGSRKVLRTGAMTGCAQPTPCEWLMRDPYSAIEQALLMKDTLGREKLPFTLPKSSTKKSERIREWLPESGLSEASQQRIIRNQ